MSEAAAAPVDPAEPARRDAAGWELRVLAGRTTGASAALARDRWTGVGHGFDNDVVLRDPGARGVRLRLRPREGSAELDLIAGEVDLLGQRLTGPATAILPAYVPLTLGEAAIALGETGGARWPDAERLLRAGRPELAPPGDEAAEPPSLPAWRVISPAASHLPKLAPALPIVGGALAAVILAALGWATVTGWLNRAPTADQAGQLLAADGFRGLQVRSGSDGLLIDGVLSRGGDLRRLQDDVARRRWSATVRVRTNDALVQTVSDVLRTNGVDAEVHAIGPGLLVATAQGGGGDPARLETLRARIAHETPGLRQLVLNGSSGGDAGLLVSGDQNKRVVSMVGGADGYVKTLDGSRYFVGAVLPDGHTVTAIEGQTVTVLKDGRSTTLTF